MTILAFIFPVITKNYNVANYAVHEIYKPLHRSNFEFNQSHLLGNLEFENMVAQRRIMVIQLKLISMDLYNLQNEMSQAITEELKK